MHNRKLILLLLGALSLLLILVFFIYNLAHGNNIFLLPTLFIFLYFIFSIKMVYCELQFYIKDRTEGVQTEIFELINYKVLSRSYRDNIAAQPLATFMSINKEAISIYGDYSNVELQIGKRYKVSYYKHTKMLDTIEEII